MFGKGALIVVAGFAIAFSTYQLNLSRAATASTDNFNRYYMETLVHNTALSAMNLGINKVWAQNWNSGSFNMIANQCSSVVTASTIGVDSIKLKVNAWGYMFDEEAGQGTARIADSVVAYFSYRTPVSRYFWFTNSEAGVYWISGDSVWGPIHTNGVLRTSGSPVFYGKVTAYRGIDPNPSRRRTRSRARFYGGWEIGLNNSVPTDVSPLVAAAVNGNDGAPINTKSLYNQPVAFEFLPDGQVVRTLGRSRPDTVNLRTIAPAGVIHSTEDIRVKGVLNGQVTLYSRGNIWIDDDIVCADDPTRNPNSDDVLGLVANNNVVVTDNRPNNRDVNIQAGIMAINGSFTAQNYAGRPAAGVLRVTGSIVQNRRGPVGTFSRWRNTIMHGFSKRYRFDSRFSLLSPPKYPYVRSLRLVGWWE